MMQLNKIQFMIQMRVVFHMLLKKNETAGEKEKDEERKRKNGACDEWPLAFPHPILDYAIGSQLIFVVIKTCHEWKHILIGH